jgi:hypothetical protein
MLLCFHLTLPGTGLVLWVRRLCLFRWELCRLISLSSRTLMDWYLQLLISRKLVHVIDMAIKVLK